MYRESRQRKAVIAYLHQHPSHPSAAEIYTHLRKTYSNLSLGTVYRNLDILEQQGRIRCLKLSQREARYDAGMKAHGHFLCRSCGQVVDLFLAPGCCRLVDELERQGMQLEKTNFDFVGVCPTCIPTTKKTRRTHHESKHQRNPN